MAKKKAIRPVDRWNPAKTTPHKNSGEVLTKPNQSMSIKDILYRNTQGMAYSNYKTPYYEEEATFQSQSLNKISDMEPTEKLQFLKDLNEQVSSLSKQIKADEKAKAEAVAQAQASAEAQENNNETSSE